MIPSKASVTAAETSLRTIILTSILARRLCLNNSFCWLIIGISLPIFQPRSPRDLPCSAWYSLWGFLIDGWASEALMMNNLPCAPGVWKSLWWSLFSWEEWKHFHVKNHHFKEQEVAGGALCRVGHRCWLPSPWLMASHQLHTQHGPHQTQRANHLLQIICSALIIKFWHPLGKAVNSITEQTTNHRADNDEAEQAFHYPALDRAISNFKLQKLIWEVWRLQNHPGEWGIAVGQPRSVLH